MRGQPCYAFHFSGSPSIISSNLTVGSETMLSLPVEMFGNMLNSLVSHFGTDCIFESSRCHDDVVNVQTAAFSRHSPQFTGHVEQEGHGCQGEGHPLVVGYVRPMFLRGFLSDVGCAQG